MVTPYRTGRSARACFSAALLTSTMLAWTPALAQDEGTRVDEVIVTAQKRSESLQDVPFSIQALGSETLEELQVTSMNDFVQFLPSVSQRSAGPGATNVYMRGVASGDNANHSGPQPSVSVYLDEQPVTTIQGALEVHVYDIARVESLAGPQGTLYGASSQAGTIRIITNKPSMAGFEGGYDLELNSVDGGDSGWSMEGFANLPLSERMALRVVGWNLYDAGYIDNVPNTRLYTARGIFLGDPLQNTPVSNAPYVEENYNDVETYGARAALRIDLDDTWSITPSIMGQDQKANGNFAFDPNIGDLMNSRYRPEHSHDRWWQAAMAIEGRIANLDVMYSGSYLNRKIDVALDYSDYSYFYDAAYGEYWKDDLGVPLNDPSQYIQGRDRFTKESHEFRVSSPQDRRVRFIAGLFHQRQQHQIRQRYKIDDLTPTYEVTGWSDTLWLTEQLRTDRDWAAFGDVTFDLTDRLSASAGVRFFKAENSLQGFFGFNSNYSTSTGENACFATPVQIEDAPCTNVDKVFEEDGFTHKLNLTYRFDDDRMVYATWSTGYRPGGVNRRGTLPPYESDFLTNYELGWKTSWLGNTLRFNGAVFYAEWEDFQIGVLGQNGLTDNRNAGGAEIKGLEADVFWRATPGLTVSGGVSLLDAQTTVNFCKADALGNTVFDCVGADLLAPPGTELPLTPDFKGNLTARNEFMIGGFDAHLQGSLVHQSSAWSDLRLIERAILGKMPSYTTLDFTGGFGRGNWTMELYLRNATDERANIQRYTQCQIQVCAGAVYIVPIQPRTVGIRFGQRF